MWYFNFDKPGFFLINKLIKISIEFERKKETNKSDYNKN